MTVGSDGLSQNMRNYKPFLIRLQLAKHNSLSLLTYGWHIDTYFNSTPFVSLVLLGKMPVFLNAHCILHYINSGRHLSSLTPWVIWFLDLIFCLILVIEYWGTSREIALKWMALDLTDRSTLEHVSLWCHQATSRYLSQWWPRSISPYGVTRPQ